jgi:hypothetical protein
MKSTVRTTLEKINQTRFVNSMKIFTGIVNIGIGHRGTWLLDHFWSNRFFCTVRVIVFRVVPRSSGLLGFTNHAAIFLGVCK